MENNNSITAVEWLVDLLQKAEYIPKDSLLIDYVIKQAKEIEKQQIIDFAVWFNKNDNSYKSYTEIVE